MNHKITINPIDVFFWNQRHSGKDIVRIYTKFSPLMQIGADTKMLNFGLWKEASSLPDAQREMSEYISDFGSFSNASKILDVGSGFCIPATIWKQRFPHLEIHCLDLNFSQLNHDGNANIISPINSSSDHIPFSNGIFDRVISLESAQHFTPLEKFFSEAKRVLADDGTLVIAIPITKDLGFIPLKLGILNFTWLSKKYSKKHVLQCAKKSGFVVETQESVGDLVYQPFTNYYIENRSVLKQKLSDIYSENLEKLIFESMKKMKRLSDNKVIDYLLLTLKKKISV